MATLASLLPDILGRLEENVEAGAPIFWNQTYEILPELVDAMFEAAMLTGVVQATNVLVTLPADTTYFSLQPGLSFGGGKYGTAVGIPGGALLALRMKAPYPIRKVSLKGLDDVVPGWQVQVNPGGGFGSGGFGGGGYGGSTPVVPNQIRGWFPLGVSGFGIWPQLEVESQVVMDFIVSPVTAPRPYTTNLLIPFQQEFQSAFPEYAASMLRSKELGAETEEAESVMNDYLESMKDLSLFQNRLDSLVFTPSYGANAGVNRRTIA